MQQQQQQLQRLKKNWERTIVSKMTSLVAHRRPTATNATDAD